MASNPSLEKFRYVSGAKRKRGRVSEPVDSPAVAAEKEDLAVKAEGSLSPTEITTAVPIPAVPVLAAKLRVTSMPVRDGASPYVANVIFKGMPGRWRERYTGICDACFAADGICSHFPELPLRCLLVGHNPSEHAFQSGFFYSNPTNRMWMLLTGTYGSKHFKGLVPHHWPIQKQNDIALEAGVGLTDLGVEPGNDAAKYSLSVLYEWREEMYQSFQGHMRRVRATLHALRSDRAPLPDGVTSADILSLVSLLNPSIAADKIFEEPSVFAPKVVAFTGKAQWKNLFEPPLKVCDVGFQPPASRPPGWPFPATTQVFVLPSSSGRAAMTEEARRAPYAALAEFVHSLPWLKTASAVLQRKLK